MPHLCSAQVSNEPEGVGKNAWRTFLSPGDAGVFNLDDLLRNTLAFVFFLGKRKTPDSCESGVFKNGAGEMNRTPDLLITNDEISLFACVD